MATTRIEDLITYNPDTGEFKWLEYMSSRAKQGWFQSKIVSDGKKTYRKRERIGIKGQRYQPSRLAWYLMKGYWPLFIDHINRDATDNRFSNLREVPTNSDNCQNKIGKGYYKVGDKYRVVFDIDKKSTHFGYFDTEKEARAKYMELKKKYHPFYYDAEV